MKRTSTVVVGGGAAGLLAAKMAAEKGHQVTLIESAPECGGLLGSYTQAGLSFDCGTHLIRDTGIAELDRWLFAGLKETEWNAFSFLATGNYFNGKLFHHGSSVDSRALKPEEYERGIKEILEGTGNWELQKQSAFHFLQAKFGSVFTEKIFRPAVEKFYGTTLAELNFFAGSLIGMDRILAFDSDRTRELKKNPRWDSIFAFHSYREGISGRRSYYPKRGGIGKWVDGLEADLKASGVQVLTGVKWDSLQTDGNGRVTGLVAGNQSWKCDELIWTIPTSLFAKSLGQKVKSEGIQFRKTLLANFVFDKPFVTDLFYFHCFDPTVESFRVTLYPNLMGAPGAPGQYHLTCEVVVDMGATPDEKALLARVQQELIDMRVIDGESRCLFSGVLPTASGFPVLTNRFVEAQRNLLHQMQQEFRNVTFCGKASGNAFFLHDTLCETYELVRQISAQTEVPRFEAA